VTAIAPISSRTNVVRSLVARFQRWSVQNPSIRPALSGSFQGVYLSIIKAKKKLEEAQKSGTADPRALRKLKESLKKAREGGFKPSFPGQHRGY
jgi:hypothetical protein